MQKPFQKSLKHLLPILRETGCRFALVGGLAVTFRGDERTTKDVDLAIAVQSDLEAERILHALLTARYEITTLLEQTSQKRLGTARLFSPISKNLIIDLMFASCGIEHEITASAETIEIMRDISLPVASRFHLIAMKILSVNETTRTRDKDDLMGLIRYASKKELVQAEKALSLIRDRGFHRGKKLLKEFKKYTRLAKK